ncbi:hypothetical protein O181_105595 [Austropuccinia psidii MF-1]|uniref:Uncharacterized protein n=1 Tax=Austropuccinia psidii MF-1 TaxID=1389203 RepID=A0A9Q3PLT2_9BASI|nr:hypothetical protein [Austropuccinia psidii MF-1]
MIPLKKFTLWIRAGPTSISGEAEDEEREESVEEEESEKPYIEAAMEGSPEAPDPLNLAFSNHPLFSQAEPNFLKMMEQMTQFMRQLTQAVASGDNL